MQLCQRCDERFSDTHSFCPDCNEQLVAWIGQEEAPDIVVLCTVLDEAKAHIMRGFLESEGIPCQLENISFHAAPAPVADLTKVRLWTLREDSERASQLLEEREKVLVCFACKMEVLVENVVCPHCGESED